MKNGLKTKEMSRQKVSKESILICFNRKRSHNKSVKQQETRKMVPSENRLKRIRCGEKRMSREEGLKKRYA